MLEHVVIIDRLLDEEALIDQQIHRCSRGIRSLEQRAAVGDVDQPPLRLDARMRADDLQVEHDATRDDRLPESAEDVHDVLRRDSSECPGEDHNVEVRRRQHDLTRGIHAIVHAAGQRIGERGSGSCHGVRVRIEREHARGALRDAGRQPAVAAADLDDACSGEVLQPAQRREMGSFGVEHAGH